MTAQAFALAAKEDARARAAVQYSGALRGEARRFIAASGLEERAYAAAHWRRNRLVL
jgi:hypothetical protein